MESSTEIPNKIQYLSNMRFGSAYLEAQVRYEIVFGLILAFDTNRQRPANRLYAYKLHTADKPAGRGFDWGLSYSFRIAPDT